VDAFVLERMRGVGLEPAGEAPLAALLRRASLDLTGLPPGASEVERALREPSAWGYERFVDRLLASPAFGEHWAAMWLDLARYADTVGYASDEARTIWRWRDWVVEAFNANMPYDKFTRLQVAGDLVPGSGDEGLLATAFHRNTPNNTEGGTDNEEFRMVAVKDRVNTTLNVWMGLTMRCAECHSHKYDPITQREYYQFLDFFNQTADADTNDDAPVHGFRPVGGGGGGAEAAPVPTPVLRELPAGERRPTHVHHRGSFRDLGEQVEAGVPEALHAMPAGVPMDRLGVAEWLVSDENPLTARVAVNRFWARLFGRGLVETEEDFGTQGAAPSHPELLDYLAVEFREGGWDVKALLRRLVLSATYRQSAEATAEALALDPENRYLARGPRFRLSAEVVRDQALAVGGLLSGKMFGPPVYPPNAVKSVRSAFAGESVWEVSAGEDRYRRALYTHLKRSQPHPLFETFDMGSREVCSLRRFRTNTPLQCLQTLNDPAFVEAAQGFAARLLAEGGERPPDQVAWGFRVALAREPAPHETAELEALFDEARAIYGDDPASAAAMASGPLADPAGRLGPATAAAMAVVANVLFNHDGFLTR
jgi:hypothetical protein